MCSFAFSINPFSPCLFLLLNTSQLFSLFRSSYSCHCSLLFFFSSSPSFILSCTVKLHRIRLMHGRNTFFFLAFPSLIMLSHSYLHNTHTHARTHTHTILHVHKTATYVRIIDTRRGSKVGPKEENKNQAVKHANASQDHHTHTAMYNWTSFPLLSSNFLFLSTSSSFTF